MKTIGLVDYYIDEWHSNNYIKWIDEICQKYGYDIKVKYAWAETDTFEGKMSTDEWCAHNSVEKCHSIDELCAKSDYIMILAPANPEKHLKYAKAVFKCGKRTYIDKTFAPCLADAEEIYKIGEMYKTHFFTTSALRYASELDEYQGKTKGMTVRGGGRRFEEYIIHQIEMLVKCMGIGAEKVKVFANGVQRICVVQYIDGRQGFLEYSPSNSFAFSAETRDGEEAEKQIESDYFLDLLSTILNFFLNGKLPFEKEQTLEAMGIRDALLKAEKDPDIWVNMN